MSPVHLRPNDLLSMCANAAGEANGFCLDLVAHGNRFGYLKFSGVTSDVLDASHAALNALASEAGPIIHNALLYLDWQLEAAFRSALLRVSTMLTFTLDLSAVLEAVCRESAALLEADGAVVWLPNEGSGAFSIAASWLSENRDGLCNQVESWCKGGKLLAQLLAEINGLYHPRAWVIGPNGPVRCQTRSSQEIKAIALFPLVDENKLIGVMLFDA